MKGAGLTTLLGTSNSAVSVYLDIANVPNTQVIGPKSLSRQCGAAPGLRVPYNEGKREAEGSTAQHEGMSSPTLSPSHPVEPHTKH